MCELAATTPAGAFVEVGVYQGGTAWHLSQLAKEQDRPLYLYDTFSGIPFQADLDSHAVGDFADTSADQVREAIPEAVVIQGIFPSSAVEMGPLAFVHLDVDQYQSYHDALAYFEPRMAKDGGIIWLDDYGCLTGANVAVNEFIRATHRRLKRSAKAYLVF